MLVEDGGANFFEIMFNCPSLVARRNIAEIVTKALICGFRILSICDENIETAIHSDELKDLDAKKAKTEKLRAALYSFLD